MDEGEEIAAAEDKSVYLKTEAGDLFTEHYNDTSETEVYSGRDEGWWYCEADDVDKEVIAAGIERVLVEEDSCDVANNFPHESEEYCSYVTLGLMLEAKIDIKNEIDTEDGGVESISTETRSIVEGGKGQIASGETAQVLTLKQSKVPVGSVIIVVIACQAISGNEQVSRPFTKRFNVLLGLVVKFLLMSPDIVWCFTVASWNWEQNSVNVI